MTCNNVSKSPKGARPNFHKLSGSVFRHFKKATLVCNGHEENGHLGEERWEVLGAGHFLTWMMMTWVSMHIVITHFIRVINLFTFLCGMPLQLKTNFKKEAGCCFFLIKGLKDVW